MYLNSLPEISARESQFVGEIENANFANERCFGHEGFESFDKMVILSFVDT